MKVASRAKSYFSFFWRVSALLGVIIMLFSSVSCKKDDLIDIRCLDKSRQYTATGTRIFEFKSDDESYYVRQGAYFDGKYFYTANVAPDLEEREITRIIKLDTKGRKLSESDPIYVDHANNLSYVPGKGLLVTHCQSKDGHYNRYSFVDIKTMEVTESGDLEYPFFSMAYSPEVKKYASGEWGGETIDIWDENMKPILHRSVEQPGSLSQGVFCDSNGIYFVRSSQNGYGSEIRIYDWDGDLTHTIPLSLDGDLEPENINIYGKTIYVIANDWSTRTGAVFTVEITEAE